MTVTSATLSRLEIARRGKHLEYFTIAWNSLEGLVAIAAGAVAGSISLVGFGIDSLIEVTSGGALLWLLAERRHAGGRLFDSLGFSGAALPRVSW